ncbi:MAG: DinB family protein [Armatimonadota bacterium]|nr:DinB family protein [Armatimonadota bacterium]MDR7400936.1 DinB family protein [Armatimonadota bacterium]MDR7404746.1 DinB family protein [Armatimonadota bacterium]MDR7438053.1 DinB family protein [Armatimonadota bacterium]MDR7472838.1 DinB family protein [Armatimonadota bacterium]
MSHPRPGREAVGADALRAALKSQYRAVLAMLGQAIRRCPDDLWYRRNGHANPFWRIAYHTLYYTHLYLMPTPRAFRPWEHHQRGIQRLEAPLGARRPYAKDEVLAYWQLCRRLVGGAVDAMDLAAPHSGFSWYRMSRLEHQIVNIRHVQYHQAQLADRLRKATGAGVNWEGGRHPAARRRDRTPPGRRAAAG